MFVLYKEKNKKKGGKVGSHFAYRMNYNKKIISLKLKECLTLFKIKYIRAKVSPKLFGYKAIKNKRADVSSACLQKAHKLPISTHLQITITNYY